MPAESKAAEAAAERNVSSQANEREDIDDDPVPDYTEATRGSAYNNDDDDEDEPIPPYTESSTATNTHTQQPSVLPTPEAPFNFPSLDPARTSPTWPSLPHAIASIGGAAKSDTKGDTKGDIKKQRPRPVAIPQIKSRRGALAPLLDSYPPALVQYGIATDSWRAFLNTMSAVLSASMPKQVLAHLGSQVAGVPLRFGRDTMDHVYTERDNVYGSVMNGDYFGALRGIVGGAIRLPIHSSLRAVDAAVSMPGVVLGAANQPPQTPKERAVAYAAATNERWLRVRGLRASLVDTTELEKVVGLPRGKLLELVNGSSDRSAAGQLATLQEYITKLEVLRRGRLNLNDKTLWLVVSEDD